MNEETEALFELLEAYIDRVEELEAQLKAKQEKQVEESLDNSYEKYLHSIYFDL